eukprot:Gb_14768 [translate_table: standard]
MSMHTFVFYDRNCKIFKFHVVYGDCQDTDVYSVLPIPEEGLGAFSPQDMAVRGRVFCRLAISFDWMRQPNSVALLLKWYSSNSLVSAHSYQHLQLIPSTSPGQTGCPPETTHSTGSNEVHLDIKELMITERKAKLINLQKSGIDPCLTNESENAGLVTRGNAFAPSKANVGIDDFLTDDDKIRGVFLQKLKGKAAVEAALAQTGMTLTRETIDRVVSTASLGGQALLIFFRWAGKQPNCQHDLNSYHNILNALGRRKYFDHVEELLRQMSKGGPLPTAKTLAIVITRYARAHQVNKAVQTFARMEDFGLHPDKTAFNTLLHSLCQENHTRSAHCLFDMMKEKISPDNITYSILMGGWCKQGRLKDVYRTLNDMIGQGLKPDGITYNYVLDSLSRAGRIEEAAQLLDSMAEKGCPPTTINYNTMISNLCLRGNLDGGLQYYDEMLAKGCTPNLTTYSLLIRYFLKARRVADGLEMFDHMAEIGHVPEVGTVNSFIEPLCKFGPPHAALRFYRKMKQSGCKPNLKTYKLLLMRLGRFGHWDKMSKLWNEMQTSGWTSDLEVYTYIVNGFCNGGKLDEAAHFMGEALRKGFCPGRIICSKLTNKLLRARKVELAYKLFLKIKDARRNDKIKRIWRSRVPLRTWLVGCILPQHFKSVDIPLVPHCAALAELKSPVLHNIENTVM